MIGPLSTTYAGDLSLSEQRQASMLVATPILVGSLGPDRRQMQLTDRFGGPDGVFIAGDQSPRVAPVLAVGAAGTASSYPLLLVCGFFWASPERSSRSVSRSRIVGSEASRRSFTTGVFGVGMVGTALSRSSRRGSCRWFGLFTTHVIIAGRARASCGGVHLVMRSSSPFQPEHRSVVPKLVAAAKLPCYLGDVRSCTRWSSGGFVAFANYCHLHQRRSTGFSAVDAGARTAGFALAAVLAPSRSAALLCRPDRTKVTSCWRRSRVRR